jgi:hypothetical protein
VAASISHGTRTTKLRSPDQLSSSAPSKPPSTLGMRSRHIHRRGTLANSPRVREYATRRPGSSKQGERAGGVGGHQRQDQRQQGNVMRPPPPASELIAPATMAATKKKA